MATLDDRASVLRPTGVTPLLTTTQLAAYYGVTPWTVNEWVKAGCPTEPMRVRGRRFDLDKVRGWQLDDEPQLVAAGA